MYICVFTKINAFWTKQYYYGVEGEKTFAEMENSHLLICILVCKLTKS